MHPFPLFYYDSRLKGNALSEGNRIILGIEHDYETDSNSQLGIIAHEIGHLQYQDSFAEQISNTCLMVILLPLSICSTFVQLPLLFPGIRRIEAPLRLVMKIISSITEGVITAINKLCYFVSGRHQELLADEFAAYLGFEKELISALEKSENCKKKMMDIYPTPYTRKKKVEMQF